MFALVWGRLAKGSNGKLSDTITRTPRVKLDDEFVIVVSNGTCECGWGWGVTKQLRLTATNAELGFGFGCVVVVVVVIDVNLNVIC